MNACPICQAAETIDVLEISSFPVHCNRLWADRAAALDAPRGDICLAFCSRCGHLFNRAFEPERIAYTADYENSLHFSPRFQQYVGALAARLVAQYNLHHKQLIEIGSGQGDFLALLCELGDNHGVGFDPSYKPGEEAVLHSPISFIPDLYSEKYAGYPADFICSRHVLEHIDRPVEFLSMLRRIVGDRNEIIVFFEVPNTLYTLHDMGIWDLIYEHCSYFSPPSLQYAFAHSGFNVLNTTTAFDGQFLTIETATAASTGRMPNAADGFEGIRQDVNRFADFYRQKTQAWQAQLSEAGQRREKVVIWGAGSKGVSFLNVLAAQDTIEYVVDINPRKQGMYIAGAGQEIVPPEFLSTYCPDKVIIMNPNYEAEIRQCLQSLGLNPAIWVA